MSKKPFDPDRYKVLFGPPPILSTEDRGRFEDVFDAVIDALKPEDFVVLLQVRHFVESTWIVDRLTRHGTVAIERWFRQSPEYREERLKLEKSRKEGLARKRAEQASQTPPDIAHLVALEDTVVDVDTNVGEILDRDATEFEHNRAFERNILFQERLDRLMNSATKRANDALRQLELYRTGLGQAVERTTQQALTSQPKKDTPDDDTFQEFLGP